MGALKSIALTILVILIAATLIAIVYTFIQSMKIKALSKKVQQKCQEYQKLACKFKSPPDQKETSNVNKIIGGEYATAGSLPHMVAFIDHGNHKLCAGTLISEKFVLTADQCIINITRPELLALKLGALSIADAKEGEEGFLAGKIHRPYPNAGLNLIVDIALIELSKPVTFSYYIRPICLQTPLDELPTTDEDLSGAGWGTDEGGTASDKLRVVSLKMNEAEVQAECEKQFGFFDNLLNICVGYTGMKRKISCPNDSGGPLQVALKGNCSNTYRQIGITSHAIDPKICQVSYPNKVVVMYTNVANFISFIVPIVWPDN